MPVCRKGILYVLLLPICLGGCEKDTVTTREDAGTQESRAMMDGQERRARSVAILKEEGVPYIEHLPIIEAESRSTRRSAEEIASRAIALCIVAVKGEGVEHEEVQKLVDKYHIRSALTPAEKAFVEDPKPSDHEKTQFCWRYECYWVMLWALGYVDSLGRPEKPCDVPKAVGILRDLGRERFIANSKLRTQREILDKADLMYRYHWAVRDARLNGKPAPAKLSPDVVVEWHYALNWLIGYAAEWDDVTTDT